LLVSGKNMGYQQVVSADFHERLVEFDDGKL